MNSSKNGFARRTFLFLGMKAVAVAALVGSVPARVWARFIEQFPVRTVEEKTFSFDPASGNLTWNGSRKEPFRLTVDGLVEQKAVFGYSDLRSWDRTEQVSDFHCVEGWSVGDLTWGGFRFSEVLKRVKPKPEARYAVFHSLGTTRFQPSGQNHYLESFPLEELLAPEKQCLLAMDLNGEPLPGEHGAPLRVIAPFDLAYKSIKFVTRIEFAPKARPGWWTLANPVYPIDAPVPTSRLRQKP